MMQAAIQLLGGFAIRGADGAVPVLARRTKAVLAALALAPGQAASREHLCALLWPDRPADQARQSLSQALSALRRSLGGAALLADRTGVGLSARDVAIDTEQFAAWAVAGDRASLTAAATLLQGPLLPGFSAGVDPFDDWLALARTRISGVAIEAMLRLGALAMAAEDAAQAQAAFARALALEPAEERAHAGLMRLHLAQGRPAAALRQFEQAATVLAREVEAAPGQELVALRAEAQQAAGNGARPTRDTVPDAVQGALLSIPVAPLRVPVVMVGGFAELGQPAGLQGFGAGVAEEVAASLSRSSWLRLVRPGAADASEARYCADGTVQRVGGRIRVTCRVTEVATGRQVWGSAFETAPSLPAAARAAVPRIVGSVEYGVQRAETSAAAALPAERPLAPYEKFLLALKLYYQYGPAPIARAVALLREAVAEEPGFVRAKALMAAAFASKIMRGAGVPGDREAGIALAYEVYSSGTDDPDALQWAADPLTQIAGDHEAAHAAACRALRVHPNSAMALTVLGHIHCFANDPKPAVKCFQRALELAPENPHYGHMVLGLGRSLMMVGRGREGIPYLRRSVQGLPGPDTGLRWWIHGLMREGRRDEAQRAASALRDNFPEFRVSLAVGRLPRNFLNPALMTEHQETLVAAGAPE